MSFMLYDRATIKLKGFCVYGTFKDRIVTDLQLNVNIHVHAIKKSVSLLLTTHFVLPPFLIFNFFFDLHRL